MSHWRRVKLEFLAIRCVIDRNDLWGSCQTWNLMTLWLQNYPKTSPPLFIHSALCSPCHCFLSILFSASLLRNPFGFIYSRHSNLRFDLSVSGYQLIEALNYFISDLISSCISQDTLKKLCFHWLTTLLKNTIIYYVSRVKKSIIEIGGTQRNNIMPPAPNSDAYVALSTQWAYYFLNGFCNFFKYFS